MPMKKTTFGVFLLILCFASPVFAQQTIDIVYVNSGSPGLDSASQNAAANAVNRLNDAATYDNSGNVYRLQIVDGIDELNDFAQSPDAGNAVYALVHGEYEHSAFNGNVLTLEDGSLPEERMAENDNLAGAYYCGMIMEYDEGTGVVGTVYCGEVTAAIADTNGDGDGLEAVGNDYSYLEIYED
jgi:hypothetical protein